ncbi:MAG: hypothetical protein JXB48_13040 [Candidatus Latescibacteria bacterium]|nr:hypothetical protein [Candidatus Latescibacterota bacterium]
MSTFRKILILLMSLLALFVILYDYEYGHLGENVLNPEWCPLCESIQSTELGHLFMVYLLFVGILTLLGFLDSSNEIAVSSLYFNLTSQRAPPYAR